LLTYLDPADGPECPRGQVRCGERDDWYCGSCRDSRSNCRGCAPSRRCIPASYRCDWVDDCGNNWDENNCGQFSIMFQKHHTFFTGVTSNCGPPARKSFGPPPLQQHRRIYRTFYWWGLRTEVPWPPRRDRNTEGVEGGTVWAWGGVSPPKRTTGNGGTYASGVIMSWADPRPKTGFGAFGA